MAGGRETQCRGGLAAVICACCSAQHCSVSLCASAPGNNFGAPGWRSTAKAACAHRQQQGRRRRRLQQLPAPGLVGELNSLVRLSSQRMPRSGGRTSAYSADGRAAGARRQSAQRASALNTTGERLGACSVPIWRNGVSWRHPAAPLAFPAAPLQVRMLLPLQRLMQESQELKGQMKQQEQDERKR